MTHPSHQAYRKATASAGANRQLLLLFDAMLDHLRLAAGLLAGPEPPIREMRRHLAKVHCILEELEKSVRLDTWEGASTLVVLYRYLNLQLAGRPSPATLQEAIDTLSRLRGAWVNAGRQGVSATRLPPAPPWPESDHGRPAGRSRA